MRTIIRNNYTPVINDYHDTDVYDEAQNKIWRFDCDGVFLDISSSVPVLDDEMSDESENGVKNKVIKKYVDDADEAEATARYDADAAHTEAINSETDARQQADTELTDAINGEAQTRLQADTELENKITAETAARDSGDTQLHNEIAAEGQIRQQVTTALTNALGSETNARTQADAALGAELEKKSESIRLEFDGENILEGENVITFERVRELFNNHKNVVDLHTNDDTVMQVTAYAEDAIEFATQYITGGVVYAKRVIINSDNQIKTDEITTGGDDAITKAGVNGLRSYNSNTNYDLGQQSIAIGHTSTAAGNQSIALGIATAGGNSSIAIGTGVSGKGNKAVAIGYGGNAGTYANAVAIGDSLASTGDATNAVVLGASNAVSKESVTLGKSNTVVGANAIVLGSSNMAVGANTIQLGKGLSTSQPNQIALGYYNGSSSAAFMIGNGTAANARSNLFEVQSDGRATLGADPTGALDAATKQYVDTAYTTFVPATAEAEGVDGLVPAPTTEDTDKFLKSDGTWAEAGSDVTLYDTILGTNEDGAPTQKAIASALFADPETGNTIKIGNNTTATGNNSVVIGTGATTSNGNHSVAIGENASALNGYSVAIGQNTQGSVYGVTIGSMWAKDKNGRSIVIGNMVEGRGQYAVAIGTGDSSSNPTYASERAVALGYNSQATAKGSISLGAYAKANAVGEMNIGASNTSYGYDNTNYRLLTGVHDPVSDQDAATKKYVDTAVAAGGAEEVKALIPEQASADNKLADKAFVNSSINSVTAFYITKNASGEQFNTKAELDAATTFYTGGEERTPTRNDYCIVLEDETKDNATTRYIYQNGQWEFQYTVNETALTAEQLAAINSGITAEGVASIAGKLDKVTEATTLGQVYYKRKDGTNVMNDVTQSNNTWTLPIRDGAGQFSVGEPTEDSHVATKKYVDDNAGGALYSEIGTNEDGSLTQKAATDLLFADANVKKVQISGATTSAEDAIGVGTGAKAKDYGAIAMGPQAQAGNRGIAVGGYSNASSYSTATGFSSEATQSYASTFGNTAKAYSAGGVAVGASASVNTNSPNAIAIGRNAIAASENAIAIGGYSSSSYSAYAGNKSIAIGSESKSDKGDGVAIGEAATNGATGATALGYAAKANGVGSVAIGFRASATQTGEFAIGTTSTAYGYDGTNTRLLTGVHDPVNNSDAATKGYVDSAIPTVPTNVSAFTNDAGYITGVADGSVTAAKLGSDVPTILSGTAAPTASQGKNGDIYIQYS